MFEPLIDNNKPNFKFNDLSGICTPSQ